MIFLKPVSGGGTQEADHLRLPEIKYIGSPGFMLSLIGIRILITACAVKINKPELILAKMRRNPVKYYPDALCMQLVYHPLDIIRRAVS